MMLQPRSLNVGEQVYVQDNVYAWLPALVLETEADRVLVQIDLPDDWNQTTEMNGKDAKKRGPKNKLAKPEERWINLDDYKDRQLPMKNEKTARDMADLMHLHEAAILYQTKQRHLAKKPYTRVGEIVVAVNPCKWIDGLYSEDEQFFYAKNFVWNAEESSGPNEEKKDESIISMQSTPSTSVYDRLGVEPHIYEVSALAYRGMFLDQENQTIVVSGESGAGKTETVKIVLEHLATLEASSLSPGLAESAVMSNELVQKIIKSSPIFEAFGNAETLRNHNSSRFGKMTRLHFETRDNGMWGLCGSTCQTYLLESNRVVSQADTERGFHIFYQLMAAPEDVKEELLGKEWRGTTADDFRYLNHKETREGKGSDKEEWSKTLEALLVFDWKEGWLKTLAQALATILKLGNVVFTDADGENGCKASTEDVLLASQMLEISPDELEHAMTHRFVETAQERVEVPLTSDVAKDSLDALVKRIYSYMFSCIVASINAQTAGSKGDGDISLLDIYGFERFDTNRFEQLCINYANERLHKKYVDDNFARFKSEYESEGIDIFDFSKIDNNDVLQLFDGPSGLIGAISEECLRPMGNSMNFVQRMKQIHSDNDRFIHEKLGGKFQFGVHHFAGPVMYDADHFVERNTDHLSPTLVSTLSRSSNEMVKGAFNLMMREKSVPRGSQQKKTVLDKFRVELKELISSIEETETRYIRCIKPNESLSPTKVDHATVLRQLKCAGLVAAIDLSRESFPSKISFSVAEERFMCLIDETSRDVLKDLPLHDRVQFMMSRLFASVLEVYRNCDFTVPYACGKTRVYFRAGALEMLESMRREYFSVRALVLQRWARSFIAKQKYAKAYHGALLLQAQIRSYVQRRKFLVAISGIAALQSTKRGLDARREFQRTKEAAITLQSLYRGFQARESFRKVYAASQVLCAAFRMFAKLHQYREYRLAAMKIQLEWQEHQLRKVSRTMPLLQAVVRGVLCRSRRARESREKEEEVVGLHNVQEDSAPALVSEIDNSSSPSVAHEAEQRTSPFRQSEISVRDLEIHQLRNEVAAIAEDAEKHTQELEAEYEERLVDYEEEVLHLRELINHCELEKARLLDEQATAKKEHNKSIEKLKAVLRKTQENHKEYLTNITSVLDKATEARRLETERIMEELQAVKRQKDSKIILLTNELEEMKKMVAASNARDQSPTPEPVSPQSSYSSKTPFDISMYTHDIALQKERLQSLLKPQNIMGIVDQTRKRSPPTKEKIIDQSITKPAEEIVERLLDIISHLELA